MAHSIYLTIYKQKIISNSTRTYYSYKLSTHFQAFPVQKSRSKSVIHFFLGSEGFCKQFSPMLHAHSSQVHLLYRKRLVVFNAAVYKPIMMCIRPTTRSHTSFRVLNTHNVENPNYILTVIYLLSCPDQHSKPNS